MKNKKLIKQNKTKNTKIYSFSEQELFERLNTLQEARNNGGEIASTVLMLLDRIEKIENKIKGGDSKVVKRRKPTTGGKKQKRNKFGRFS